jgi:hypothetical protein
MASRYASDPEAVNAPAGKAASRRSLYNALLAMEKHRGST